MAPPTHLVTASVFFKMANNVEIITFALPVLIKQKLSLYLHK